MVDSDLNLLKAQDTPKPNEVPNCLYKTNAMSQAPIDSRKF